MGCLFVIVVLAVAGYAYFGSPVDDLADLVWKRSPAPWESVDAYYYPSAADRSAFEARVAVGGLDDCRTAVHAMAESHGDPDLRRGDYECGVGFVGEKAGVKVYRLTLK